MRIHEDECLLRLCLSQSVTQINEVEIKKHISQLVNIVAEYISMSRQWRKRVFDETVTIKWMRKDKVKSTRVRIVFRLAARSTIDELDLVISRLNSQQKKDFARRVSYRASKHRVQRSCLQCHRSLPMRGHWSLGNSRWSEQSICRRHTSQSDEDRKWMNINWHGEVNNLLSSDSWQRIYTNAIDHRWSELISRSIPIRTLSCHSCSRVLCEVITSIGCFEQTKPCDDDFSLQILEVFIRICTWSESTYIFHRFCRRHDACHCSLLRSRVSSTFE